MSASVQLNNGNNFDCQLDQTVTLTPAGRASNILPGRIDCITPGTRCVQIK
jgi:hypothetical protein